MATIRPNALPAAGSVSNDSAIIVDSGSAVQKATPLQVVDAAIPLASQAEAQAGTDNAKRMTPLRVLQAIEANLAGGGWVALTDAATITPNFASGSNFRVTLGGSRTLANPSNAIPGQSGGIEITQDATGSRALSFGANWRFPGGAAIGGALSATPNTVDLLSYVVRSDGTILASVNRNFIA